MTPWQPGDLERLRAPRLGTIARELRGFVVWLMHGSGAWSSTRADRG